eukprot:TRINITY_DN10110_c0_g2_i1.p1 TRINITY_DN10110_c0_g2~~TRINITY_DN10110_c0_g2_i1.p1  ORF type:complete len:527 (-),score=73.41 TRINITY_DN10110_c0_g2_i1:184-1764(-)
MWARRLGAPPLWPSRVKVFFLALLTSVFIFSVFQYLHNANIDYLNLQRPAARDIVCKLPREECRRSSSPVACTVRFEDRTFWRGLNLSNPCPARPRSVQTQTCRNLSLPLSAITGELSSLHTVNNGVNPFRVWSILFLVLTSLLSVSILIHDMALIDERSRPSISSLHGVRYFFPRAWRCWEFSGISPRVQSLWRQRPCLSLLLVPLLAFVFMVVLYPLALLVSVVAPVRMSRIMVFLSGIFCMLWSVVFIIAIALFDTHVYAVLWSEPSPPSGNCVCLCEFPLNQFVVARIVALGVGVCWHSFNITFRALKGLRRGQWANMFSVLHAVPIEAFPIMWERPLDAGGGPIDFRSAGEPVQAEPAFDPFCLMDEQPESAWTKPLIVPVSRPSAQKQQHWEPYLNTADPIGCCGFPQLGSPLRDGGGGCNGAVGANGESSGERTPSAAPRTLADLRSLVAGRGDWRPHHLATEDDEDTSFIGGGDTSADTELLGVGERVDRARTRRQPSTSSPSTTDIALAPVPSLLGN